MVITFLLVATDCIVIFLVQHQYHESAIYNKIESMGGKVISFHRQMTSELIGWVKFGWFANWKL